MKRTLFLFAFVFVSIACSSSSPPVDAGGDAQNPVDGAADTAAADTAAETAPPCKHAGDTCAPTDNCNTWSCKCANITDLELTGGSCSGGTCQSGADACAALCANAGGVTSATDSGC